MIALRSFLKRIRTEPNVPRKPLSRPAYAALRIGFFVYLLVYLVLVYVGNTNLEGAWRWLANAALVLFLPSLEFVKSYDEYRFEFDNQSSTGSASVPDTKKLGS